LRMLPSCAIGSDNCALVPAASSASTTSTFIGALLCDQMPAQVGWG
jgi:hypothetical protein